MDWYYESDGETCGPVGIEQLKQLVRDGKLDRASLIWNGKAGADWVPAAQIPLLSGVLPPSSGASPGKEAEFERAAQARRREEQAARKKVVTVSALVAVAIAAGIALFVYLKVSTPFRELGISARHPVGEFATVDRHLTKTLLMDKRQAMSCPVVDRPNVTVWAYANPKGDRGRFINDTGEIFLLIDGEQRLLGVCAAFVTSGRGINESICSIWAKHLWSLLEPGETQLQPMSSVSAAEIAKLPLLEPPESNAKLAFHEGLDTRGFWYEYGHRRLKSAIFLERR